MALNVEATRKCRCVGVCGQVAGVLPGPSGLLPAEDRETPEQGVSVPPAEQTDCLRVFRSGDERAAVWCVVNIFTFHLIRLITAHPSGTRSSTEPLRTQKHFNSEVHFIYFKIVVVKIISCDVFIPP